MRRQGPCLKCEYRLAWIAIEGKQATRHNARKKRYAESTKETCEALLKRIRELDAEIAQHERNMREGEARLPLEEQLRLKLWRFIEANIPELAGKIDIDSRN